MDFKKICSLYANTSLHSSSRRRLYPHLIKSFQILQTKRQKLSVGAMGFIHQPVYLGKMLVGSRFTLDYKNQTSLKATAKSIDSTLQSLSLRRDFQSLFVLSLGLNILGVYLSLALDLYLDTFIRADLDPALREPLLTNVMSLGFINAPSSSKFALPLLVKVALKLNTFF